MIVINFKTYEEITTGDNILNLAKDFENISNQYQVPIVLVVQASDIYRVSQITTLPVFAQHIDPIDPGKNTGFTTWLAVKQAGAVGTLINHSEHRISMDNIVVNLKLCKDHELQSLVCVENADEAYEVDKLGADMIALEDPILIGGDISIVANESGKEQVRKFIDQHLTAKALVGAGVKNQADIKASLELGASGVLLASGIVKAENPKAVLIDLCEGFKK